MGYTDQPLEDDMTWERRLAIADATIPVIVDMIADASAAKQAGDLARERAIGDQMWQLLEETRPRDLALLVVQALLPDAEEELCRRTQQPGRHRHPDDRWVGVARVVHHCPDPAGHRIEDHAAGRTETSWRRTSRGLCGWCGLAIPPAGGETR